VSQFPLPDLLSVIDNLHLFVPLQIIVAVVALLSFPDLSRRVHAILPGAKNVPFPAAPKDVAYRTITGSLLKVVLYIEESAPQRIHALLPSFLSAYIFILRQLFLEDDPNQH